MPFFKKRSLKSLPSLDNCHIEFKRVLDSSEEFTPVAKLSGMVAGFRKFFKKIYNTCLLIKHRELRAPLLKNVCPMRWVNAFPSLFFDMKVVCAPALMKAMLKHPRKDPGNGFFDDQGNAEIYLPLLKDLYPEANFSEDDFLLTCNKDYVHTYRQPILQFLGSKNIKKNGSELQKIAEEAVREWREQSIHGKVNATQLSQGFSVLVISKLLLGHPGPFEVYREISTAIDFINKSTIKRAWKIPFSADEKQRYQQSLEVVRKAIETSLTTGEKPCLGSLIDVLREEKQLTSKQLKALLFVMYLAGSETSASLLSYLLWQLGQHPDYQEEIFKEINEKEDNLFDRASHSQTLNKVFAESIRLFSPGYVINRHLSEDVICTIKDKEGRAVFCEKIKKGDMLMGASTLAGRDPLQYENPNEFNPHRFQMAPTLLPWLPFGEGIHTCPGQWLAKSEVIIFAAALIQRYKMRSSPDKEMGQKGYLTLKAAEDVWLTLEERK